MGKTFFDVTFCYLNLSPLDTASNRENALCCGTSAWMECSSYSKSIQIERIQEAIQTGAQTLITACPKCCIHLTCAQSNTESDLKVMDLYPYIWQRLSETESDAE